WADADGETGSMQDEPRRAFAQGQGVESLEHSWVLRVESNHRYVGGGETIQADEYGLRDPIPPQRHFDRFTQQSIAEDRRTAAVEFGHNRGAIASEIGQSARMGWQIAVSSRFKQAIPM